ncbi:PREDICTED: histone-lysine N-methyltransferase SUV420H1-B-like [Diuraphis noxia]|uniref:histone-lysine N-methyltransferase SUV420H1-B-like n=1 Tax=Diuraphis noxia TaxID=143948 RepID=UPI000763A061|nr:PREDICTED: histone-lysine N-methyltransferase SUV420H1-B-like [Diuraphis noxia]
MPPRRLKSIVLSVADDLATEDILDKHIGFATHKTKADVFKFSTKTELNTLKKQIDIYKKSVQDTYTINQRFKNLVNDIKIVAKQVIPRGTVIKTLCGQTAIIYPEHIIKGVNDFSILRSSKSNKDLLFLGPAAYVNHSCSPNTDWSYVGEGVWCAKAIKDIDIEREITTNYGPSYFGEDNIDCECEIHEVDRVNNDANELNTANINDVNSDSMPVSSSDSPMADKTKTGMNTKLLAFVCVSFLKERNKTVMDSKSGKANNVKNTENTVDNLHNSTCNISYPSIAGEDETALLEISSNDDVNDTPKNEE